MKEDGENASDGLHSSKRLRLSILRSQSRGFPRIPYDSAGPSHGASTSSNVNLSSISCCGVKVGTAADLPESSIQAEATSFRHNHQNASLHGTDDDAAASSEGKYFIVCSCRRNPDCQQPTGAGDGLLEIPHGFVDDVAIQEREQHGSGVEDGTNHSIEGIPAELVAEVPSISGDLVGPSQGNIDALQSGEEVDDGLQGVEVEDGTNHSIEGIPAELVAEVPAISGDLVGPSQGNIDALQSGEEVDDGLQGVEVEGGTNRSLESISVELSVQVPAINGDLVGPPQGNIDTLPSGEEADGLQGGEVSGDGSSSHLQQEIDLTRSQEMDAEVRPLVSQEQDEALPHNVLTFDQSGTPALGQPPETRLEVVEAEGEILHTEARNQVAEAIELSEDDGEAESAGPILTASAFAEPRQTLEDFDAFAPEPQSVPKEGETSKPEHFDTQLDSEGTTCPICMEPWTSTGCHRICSLACGHLFGKSCIKRWLKLAGKKQGKCPHCNRRARPADLRTLYVPRLAVLDGEGQQYMQEAGLLRTENEQLKKQVVDLREEVRRTQTLLLGLAADQNDAFAMSTSSVRRPQDLRGHFTFENRRHEHQASRPAPHRVHESMNHDRSSLQSGRSTWERPQVEHLPCLRSADESPSRPIPQDQQNWRLFDSRNSLGTGSHVGMILDLEQRREEIIAARPLRSSTSLTSAGSIGLERCFLLQNQRSLHGAKVFDMDAQSQLLLVSGRPPDSMTSSGLTKMSLLDLSEGECMNLPFGTGAIRDIRIASTGTRAPGRLALVASLGKKLSLFSLESNNVVVTYKLPNPAWACAWDPCDPNRVYTGLQNGTLLTFDMRQTSSPLDTLKGPSSTPVHTLQYVPENGRVITHEGGTSMGRGLLSASSSTLLFWPGIDQPQEKRPVCLSQPGGSSVCVSVSYNAAVDVMVASFRPKPIPVPLNDGASSSTLWTHSQADVPSQLTPGVLPETVSTASVSVHIPTHFSYVRTSRQPAETSSNLTASALWEQQGAMVGHKSQAVLSRTSIVNEWTGGQPSQTGTGAGQGCLFASGDEGSNSVWLWDLGAPTVKQMLRPHPYSPVLDIRTAHVAGIDLLGCISERTLQLYRRVPG